MNKTGKFLIAGLALSFASSAWASATMKDVETAVKVNHDFRQAENLSHELVVNNPNNARDHWVYSQILHHNAKDDLALHELAEAKRIDPASSFVSDPHKVAAYESTLNATTHVASTPSATPPRIASATSTPVVVAPVAPTPAPVPEKPNHTVLWAILIVGVVCIIGFIFARRAQEKARREDEERMNTKRQGQLNEANALLVTIKPFKLDIRMANPPKPEILAQVDEVERNLVSLIEQLGKTPVTQAEIDRLSSRLSQLHRQFDGSSSSAHAASSDSLKSYQGMPGSTNGQFQGNEYSSSSPVSQNSIYQHAQPIYQQPIQQTVYVENNNGMDAVDGLVTGMVLGEMMGGGRDREVIHEREVVREVTEVHDQPQSRYYEPEGTRSSIDYGNESVEVDEPDERDSGNNSNSSDIDFGSDSSSGSDSVDFGGSDDN